MIRLLISTTWPDANPMNVLLNGLSAHADVEAFPFSLEDAEIPPILFKMLPYLKHLSDTWVATFHDPEALITLVKIAESIKWSNESLVVFAADDGKQHWTLPQFHKRVMVEGAYREKVA